MTQEQKALECLQRIAAMAAEGKRITIAPDWGFGSATLIFDGECHTHIGNDCGEDTAEQLASFVDGLHSFLVHGCGLSIVK